MAKAAISETIRLGPEALNREWDEGGRGTWDNGRSADAHAREETRVYKAAARVSF